MALAISAVGSCATPPVTVSVDCITVPPNEGFSFQMLKLELRELATFGAVL